MNRRRRLSNWRGTPLVETDSGRMKVFLGGTWDVDMGEAVETVRGWNLDLACMPQAGLRLDLQRVLHGQPSSALTADRRSPRCLHIVLLSRLARRRRRVRGKLVALPIEPVYLFSSACLPAGRPSRPSCRCRCRCRCLATTTRTSRPSAPASAAHQGRPRRWLSHQPWPCGGSLVERKGVTRKEGRVSEVRV